MIEGIAAASMCMSAAKVQQAVSVSLLKDAMQQQEASAQNLIQTLSNASTGHIIDTYA